MHATADGVLLAFHDNTLDRVTDRRGQVARLPWSEVSRARIGGVEPIPLLEDLLGAWPDIRLNVDVKEAGAVQPLVRDPGAHRRHRPGLRGLVLPPPAAGRAGRPRAAAVHLPEQP